MDLAVLSDSEKRKCSNCSRGPQPIAEFVNAKGKTCSTCNKCRIKGQRLDQRRTADPNSSRAVYKKQYQKEKKPWESYRERERAKDEELFLKRNADVMKQYRSTHKEELDYWCRHHANYRFNSIRCGARHRDLSFDITLEQYVQLSAQVCWYCHEMDSVNPLIGVDRIDNHRGYVMDNLVPCCIVCNNMKIALDPRTFVERCKAVSHAQEHKEPMDFPEAYADRHGNAAVSSYRLRAANKGLFFSIDDAVARSIMEEPCRYCLTVKRSRGLDRVDNAQGYDVGNVVACCSPCNYLKGDLSLDVFISKCHQIACQQHEFPDVPRCVHPLQKRQMQVEHM